MAIRFVLVGLVASLGFDLPSGDEMSSWVRAGRGWVQARIDDVQGVGVVCVAKEADAEFAGVVDAMADSFAADLAAAERPKSIGVAAFAPIEVADDSTRESPGLGLAAEGVGTPAGASERIEGGRPGRLVAAVELTKQAASAWMSVLNSDGASDRP